MAPKRSTPLDDPPSASSDDDETEEEQEPPKTTQESSSSSSDEEEEEEEGEAATDPVKNSLEKSKTLTPNSKAEHSSSEEDSKSESESEEKETPTPMKTSVEKPKSCSDSESEPELSSPTASAFTIKPSKKPNDLQTPEKKPNSKRPAFETDDDGRKKSKVSNGDVVDEKKSTVKRVWSDEDELVLLQGFLDYQSEKGCSPLSDIDGFHGFIMDSLPGNVSKNQLYEKIKRLKKKFQVNIEKVGDNGDDPVFSKPHEHKLFELSKKIWGSDNGNGRKESGKAKVKPKEEEEMWDKGENFETLYPYWNAGLSLNDYSSLSFPKGGIELIKQNVNLIGRDKAREMEELWMAHFHDSVALRAKRITLMGEVCDLVTKSLGK